jgi:hypothetical protein
MKKIIGMMLLGASLVGFSSGAFAVLKLVNETNFPARIWGTGSCLGNMVSLRENSNGEISADACLSRQATIRVFLTQPNPNIPSIAGAERDIWCTPYVGSDLRDVNKKVLTIVKGSDENDFSGAKCEIK